MKTETIFDAYVKALKMSYYSPQRYKWQRIRWPRYTRQMHYFERKLRERLNQGDQAIQKLRQWDDYNYEMDDFNFRCARENATFGRNR